MNDQDLIQRNQIYIMRALALIIDGKENSRQTELERQYSKYLWTFSEETQKHLGWKLAGSPTPAQSPNLVDIAKATETNPWPSDLDGTEKEKWR